MKRLIAFLSVLLCAPAYADGFGVNDKVLYFNSNVLIDVIKNTFPQNLQLDVANKYVELMDKSGNVSIADLITVCGVGNLDNAKCRNFINDLITAMGDDTIKPFYWADYVSADPEPIRLQTYSSGDGYHKNPGLTPGEWAMTFGWMKDSKFIKQYPQTKYIRGHSACTADAGTPYTIDASKNYTLNENTGEHCWCKMVGPEESPWVYNKSGDTMAGGCERSCALECLSALRAEPMRAAMFSVVKLNGSNANTSDEKVIGDDLITAVTPPPPPKPKPAPTPKPEPAPTPKPEPLPGMCWEGEDSRIAYAVDLNGRHCYSPNEIHGPLSNCSGLSTGQWKVIFDCGTVTGIARCAANKGIEAQIGNPHGDKGKYCWCKGETSYPQQYKSSPVWVFRADFSDSPGDPVSTCADLCSANCALGYATGFGGHYDDFRYAVFGLSNN